MILKIVSIEVAYIVRRRGPKFLPKIGHDPPSRRRVVNASLIAVSMGSSFVIVRDYRKFSRSEVAVRLELWLE